MKETVGSLRLYFIIVAVFGCLANAFALSLGISVQSLVPDALSVIGLALAAAYFYVGVRLASLLTTNLRLVRTVVYANIGLTVVNAAINLAYGFTKPLLQAAIGLAIAWYLLSSVNRLSAQIATAEVVGLGQE